MPGEPYTACELRVTSGSLHERLASGDFLRTRGGSAYQVMRVAGRTLHVMRWPPSEVPADARVYGWEWGSR